MGDFLTAIKSVSLDPSKKQDELLTTVSTQTRRRRPSNRDPPAPRNELSRQIVPVPETKAVAKHATTPAEALQLLRSEPDAETLILTLKALSPPCQLDPDFFIHATGPLQAQIIQTLLTTIIPSFWNARGSGCRAAIIPCLRNPTGLNAILARLRILSDGSAKPGECGDAEALRTMLSVARHVVKGDSYVRIIQQNLRRSGMRVVKEGLARKDFANVLASGKIVSVVAQAEDVAKVRRNHSMLSSGSQFATWLGRNVSFILQDGKTEDESLEARAKTAAEIVAKAARLGYSLELVKALFSEPVSLSSEVKPMSLVQYCRQCEGTGSSAIGSMYACLPGHAQAQMMETVLRWLNELLPTTSLPPQREQTADIRAATGLLNLLTNKDQPESQLLARHLEDPVLSAMLSLPVRRAAIKTLSRTCAFDLQALLEKVMSTFNDRLFIKYAPLAQQDATARNLLLLAGYVHRANPVAMLMVARSSGHMQGVSSRLDTSSHRARWLGMVVATGISSLVDKQGSKMSFGTEEMETEEAVGLLGLVSIADDVGDIGDFADLLESHKKTQRRKKSGKQLVKTEKLPMLNGKQTFGPPRPPELVQTEVEGEKTTEIFDDEDGVEEEENSGDDLKPYAKPDSDPEDSDEDATLVNRNKARPPVYVRDLMAMLRDDKDHDRFTLGIKHAAALIRRKSNFGREVTDHAEELANILCNLQDPFATEDFDELRLQGLIAVLLSDATTLGPWLSTQAFTGDYSLSQRCLILSSLGLGGRELAGLVDEDSALNPSKPNTTFASKQLPAHLHNLYTINTPTSRLEAQTKTLESTLMKPLALSAADKTTAHLNAVKVRTFSSRLSITNRTSRNSTKNPNTLAKVFSTAVFYPLINNYNRDITYNSSSSVYASSSIVLTTFLKTLALLLHASGPATLGLHDVVVRFWQLLLSLRVRSTGDRSVLEAVLFSFLTLLEVRASAGDVQGFVRDCGGVLQTTQEWVGGVFEVLEGAGAREEEAKCRSLAAGVLVRLQEVLEQGQVALMGGMGRG